MNQSAPEDFIKNLHETIAWCIPRVDISNPKYCLRSAELKPDYEFSSRPDDDVDLWADTPMIDKLIQTRAQLLTQATFDMGRGRLLIHFLYESNHNGATADVTSYYLDNNDTPPWDTWVQAFIPESLAHQSPDEVPIEFPFLISWVPPEFVKIVHEATEVECVGMLMWADAPRRWDGPREYADSIPDWLQRWPNSR